jgi:hypothetical protein
MKRLDACNLANLVEGAAVRTTVILQHLIAEDTLFQRFEGLLGFVFLLVSQAFHHLLL